MYTIYELIQKYALSFGLILSRLTGMMLIVPMFAGFSIPTEILIVTVIALSYMCLPLIGTMVPITLPLGTLVLSVLFNLFVGFYLGLIAYTIVGALYVGSEIFGIQSGFNVSGSLDPTMEESPLTSEFLYLMGLYIFVSLKGHLLILKGVIDSTKVFPLVLTTLPFDKFEASFFKIFWESFLFSLQIALPIIGLMFLVNVLFGILSRLVPQMNVFMVAMPASTMILFLLMVGMIPVWVELIAKFMERLEPYLAEIFGM
ncbi:flagellar biosynthetic protein FliR [Fervidobacterium thailandense]|uniref:Type III secretion protein n=1 Tax=Fervidobacterium thailandense TaxID=1008305 RepID=A0A1E3G4C2_9BACT|nr:flagellar biosynthetic protein FliR [Fervidobacterium thailandense]ODN30683.1 type III secretion protein [Fervidobacterium thailandense]